MLTTKAIFERKENWFEPQDSVIEKIVTLSAEEYKAFSQNMLRDHDFITNNKDSMFVDENGVWHGMLVLDSGSDNAILVESEGANYARYASFLPNFKSYVDRQIHELANQIIKDGTQNTSTGNWIISFDKVEKQFGVAVSEDNGIAALLENELEGRDEIADLDMTDGNIDVVYHLAYCPNLVDEAAEIVKPRVYLADLLPSALEDVHLCHSEVDNEPATIVQLTDSTLTAEGKKAWADVLQAGVVERIYTGMYGLQIEISGVKPSRLDAFSAALAGYCSEQDYAKWFTQEQEPPMTMSMEHK